MNQDNPMFKLACVRGTETFGLTISAPNVKTALARAKKMLSESGYSVYPLGAK